MSFIILYQKAIVAVAVHWLQPNIEELSLMTINVSHLIHVSNAKYNGFIRRYTGEAGLKEALNYETYLFNALERYVDSGNVYHLNTMLAAAKNMSKVRVTQRILKGMSAHSFNKTTKEFDGKASKRKLKGLRTNSKWEVMFIDNLESEQQQENKAEAEWNQEAAILRLVKTASKKGNIDALITQMHHAIAELPSAQHEIQAHNEVRAA